MRIHRQWGAFDSKNFLLICLTHAVFVCLKLQLYYTGCTRKLTLASNGTHWLCQCVSINSVPYSPETMLLSLPSPLHEVKQISNPAPVGITAQGKKWWSPPKWRLALSSWAVEQRLLPPLHQALHSTLCKTCFLLIESPLVAGVTYFTFNWLGGKDAGLI